MQMDPSLKLETHQGGERALSKVIALDYAGTGGCSGGDGSLGLPAPPPPFKSQHFILDGLTFHKPRAARAVNALKSTPPKLG